MTKRKRIRQLEAEVKTLNNQIAHLNIMRTSMQKRLDQRDETITNIRKALGDNGGFVVYGGGGGGGAVRIES